MVYFLPEKKRSVCKTIYLYAMKKEKYYDPSYYDLHLHKRSLFPSSIPSRQRMHAMYCQKLEDPRNAELLL